MKYPTVIRWPFEKITFFNQKAELFRVHNRLYQISEEIKERGHGICQEPSDFLKELDQLHDYFVRISELSKQDENIHKCYSIDAAKKKHHNKYKDKNQDL